MEASLGCVQDVIHHEATVDRLPLLEPVGARLAAPRAVCSTRAAADSGAGATAPGGGASAAGQAGPTCHQSEESSPAKTCGMGSWQERRSVTHDDRPSEETHWSTSLSSGRSAKR